MSEFNTTYDLDVQSNVSQIQNFLNLVIIFCVIASFTYFLFYVGAISDKIFLGLGEPYMQPLAQFLTPNVDSTIIYKLAGIKLIALVLPIFFLQFVIAKLEESLIAQHKLKAEKKRQIEYLNELKSYAARFDSIKTYTICLSLDYESAFEVSKKNKISLNNVIFTKISNALMAVDITLKMAMDNDVLIITSENFGSYDKTFDVIMKELSTVKEVIENKYSYKLVPSITTDAFSDTEKATSKFNSSNIRKQHFEIQSFNFRNRALTTAMFAQKYRHLKQQKYAGIPIGEYVYFNKEKTNSYELNVIHKNLVHTLTKMKA